MSIETVISFLDSAVNAVGGPLLVALFYFFRFNSLRGTRSYTTRLLYHFGLLTFITPFVSAYFLLSGLSDIEAVWVLIFVWLIPVLPMWRSFCQRIAQIPSYAHSMQQMLAAAPFELPAEDLPAIRRKVARFGYHLDDFHAVQSTSIQSRFLKITAIMHHLDGWSRNGATFMQRNSEQYSELRRNYDLLSFKAIRTLRSTSAIYGAIMDDTKVEPDDWGALDQLACHDQSASRLQSASQTASGSMLEDLRKDMDFLLNNLFLFLARGVLASEWNFARCRRRLETIGFKIERSTPSLSQTIIGVLTVTTIWSLIWLIPLTANGLQAPTTIARTFVLPAANIILNILVVYYFKRNFAFANEGVRSKYPIEFILTVGILTAFLMLPLRSVFDYFQYPEQFVHVFLHGLPLSFFSWSVGATTALLMQDAMWDQFKSVRMRRIMDAIVFGTCMVLSIMVLLTFHQFFPIPQMAPMDKPGMVFVAFALSFSLGFVIGYLVMARVREAASLSAVRTHPTPITAALVHA